MKHWFNTHYKTLIIAAFLIPIITVAIVSISHVTKWYGISNPVTWAVYLSIGIEIAALSALAAISANMGKKVYFPFAIVTIVQFIGNIYFAYSFIDINSKSFQDWVGLVSPIVEFMGVDPTDFSGHKRFLAFFAGGMLPLISLSFLHMLVQFTEEDRLNEVIHDVDEKIVNKVDAKDIVSEVSKLRLSEEDLAILEKHLLNPQPPNEALRKAAEDYKKRGELLSEIMKNDQELGLYDEPFENPLIKEEPNSVVEITEDEDWGGLSNEELIGDDEIPSIEQEKTQLQKLEEYVNPIQEEVIFHEEPTIEEEQQNFSTIEPIIENNFQEEEQFNIPVDEAVDNEPELTFEQGLLPDEMLPTFDEVQPETFNQDPTAQFSDEFISEAIEEFNMESIKEEIEDSGVDVKEINNTLYEVNQMIDNPIVEETPLPLEMTSILPQPQVEDEKKNSKSLI